MQTNNKLREALKQALYFLRRHHTGAVYATDGETLIFCDEVADIVEAALAEPVKNCDVGTAVEQAQRFYNFCTEHSSSIHGMCDSKCPCIDNGDKCHCLCKWAQMPYEEGGVK